MIVLSIDPGINGCGCALWDGSKLLSADYVKNYLQHGDRIDRAKVTARKVELYYRVYNPDQIVIEEPQTYGGRAARGDANDLIAVAFVVGSLAASFDYVNVEVVLPRRWKGSAPKDVIAARAAKQLSNEEMARVKMPSAKPLQHNVWDAIGIGLWWLKSTGIR